MSGDVHWRNFTAMDDYYQNGPLPAWPGWYVQHLPHWFHAGTVVVTLAVELVIVWALFLPRRFRIACFAIVTALQIGIIATANYAFLNYIVLCPGRSAARRSAVSRIVARARRVRARVTLRTPIASEAVAQGSAAVVAPRSRARTIRVVRARVDLLRDDLGISGARIGRRFALPERALEPFRIANAYGLFATMTEARYEIEFQGSADSGRTWIAYPFRYKPQDVMERPRIYAPYQPRFDWNLWFASLERVAILAMGHLDAGAPRRGERRACSRFSAGIRSPGIRPQWCARCSGSTGSRMRPPGARRVRGGGARASGCSRGLWRGTRRGEWCLRRSTRSSSRSRHP